MPWRFSCRGTNLPPNRSGIFRGPGHPHGSATTSTVTSCCVGRRRNARGGSYRSRSTRTSAPSSARSTWRTAARPEPAPLRALDEHPARPAPGVRAGPRSARRPDVPQRVAERPAAHLRDLVHPGGHADDAGGDAARAPRCAHGRARVRRARRPNRGPGSGQGLRRLDLPAVPPSPRVSGYQMGIKPGSSQATHEKQETRAITANSATSVPRDGIEPPTRGFSVPCSTN